MRWSDGTYHTPTNDNRVVDSIPPSYTIYKSGSSYYGEANHPDLSDITSNTTFETVWQGVHDAMPSGGRMHLKGGTTYTLSAAGLTASNPGIKITGDGYSTKITQANGADITWFIDVTGQYFMLKDIYLEGDYTNNTGSGGVRVQSAGSYHHILNSYLWHFNTYCLYDDANNARISHNYIAEANKPLLFGASDSVIDHNEIGGASQGSNKYCVHLATTTYLRLIGNKIFTSDEFLIYADSPRHCVINDNIIGPSTSNDGIYMSCGAAAYGKYNEICNNVFYTIGRDAIRFNAAEMDYNLIANNIFETVTGYAFWTVTSGADYNQVLGNKLISCGNTIGIQGGENTIVKDNEGYNPIGKVANCFDTTNHKIELSGDAAAPGESGVGAQKFTVCNADIVLSSTDSGGADCDIQVYDPSDNAILQSAVSTIQYMYVPVGYKVDWGVYSGAEPTVTVAFI